MSQAIYDNAHTLAAALKSSEEYAALRAARETAFANETTKGLIAQYHQLQVRSQAAAVSGKKDEALLSQLQRLGEFLQLDPAASAYLLAEYRLSRMLGDVYKILGEAIDVDLSALEA